MPKPAEVVHTRQALAQIQGLRCSGRSVWELAMDGVYGVPESHGTMSAQSRKQNAQAEWITNQYCYGGSESDMT
jgi:hypothetical protein